MYGSEAQFANAEGLTPFDIPNTNNEIGYEGKNPEGSGDLYVGPDGQVYNTANLGQETPGQASLGDYNSFAAGQAPAAPPAALVSQLSQPAYESAPTLQTPTYATPAANVTGAQLGTSNVSPQLLAALGPQAAEALTYQGFAPQAQSAENNLNQTLADAGIVGGGAVSAQDQLQGQLAASLAPSLAGEVTNSQNNLLSAANTGTGNQQQAALSNQDVQQNTNLNNAGIANATNASNVGSVNSTNNANTGAYNTAEYNQLMALLQQYSGEQSAYAGVNSATQGGSNNIAEGGASAYQVPGANNGANSLASALGGAQTTPQVPSYQYNPVVGSGYDVAEPASTAAAANDFGAAA